MMSYQFPFDTCEKKRLGSIPIQPYSFSVNVATTLMLAYLAIFICQTPEVRFLLFSFTAFEAWHSFSHAVHIQMSPNLQNRVVHAIGYMMFISTYLVMEAFDQHHDPQNDSVNKAMLFFIGILDMWVLKRLGGVYSIASGLGVYVTTVCVKFHAIPLEMHASMLGTMAGTAILTLFFINEAFCGEKMMKWKALPYHIIIEMLGLYLFWRLAWFFIEWENIYLSSIDI